MNLVLQCVDMRRGSVRLPEVFLHNSDLITVVLETTVVIEVRYVKQSISQIKSHQCRSSKSMLWCGEG